MDKHALLKKLIDKLSADLATMTEAALVAHEAATHAESKAEDPYDTRGLEASYLAGAQSKRAMDLQETIDLFRHIDIKNFSPNTPISATSVIELRSDSEDRSLYYLLMPKGGGLSVTFEGKSILVVTPQAPLGKALLGRAAGDTIELEVQKTVREFEILSVW